MLTFVGISLTMFGAIEPLQLPERAKNDGNKKRT
jgi:hypothetical protein